VVVLNDPQTAAMSVPLARAGANVVWCCHVDIDFDNEFAEHAWRCLRPRLAGAQRFVFSRYTSLPEWLGGVETSILTPSIDPASTKNRPMSDRAARAILQHLGLAAGVSTATAGYECTDGSTATLTARPTIRIAAPAADGCDVPRGPA
jgi:trehalose synthase